MLWQATSYLNKLPAQFQPDDLVLVVDPMLATGGTMMQVGSCALLLEQQGRMTQAIPCSTGKPVYGCCCMPDAWLDLAPCLLCGTQHTVCCVGSCPHADWCWWGEQIGVSYCDAEYMLSNTQTLPLAHMMTLYACLYALHGSLVLACCIV